MPTNVSPRLKKLYAPHPQAEARRLSATRLAEAILAAPDVDPSHRRQFLSFCLWKHTEADGKWAVRYRSKEAVHGPVADIQHEHVIPRNLLVEKVIANLEHVGEILASVLACLVTKEEHRRLTAVGSFVEGWDRYTAAGVVVLDMVTGEPFTPPQVP